MSVINQMLQDLERRHAGPEDRHSLPDEVRPLPAASDRGHARRVGGWTLAVAGAGTVAWLLIAGRIELPVFATLAAPAAAGVPAVTVAPQAPEAQPGLPDVLQAGSSPIGQALPPLPPDAPGSVPEVGSVPVGGQGVSTAGMIDAAPSQVAARLSTELAAVPAGAAAGRLAASDHPSGRPDRGEWIERDDRSRTAAARQSKRDAANAETERLVRDVVGAPIASASAGSVAAGTAPTAATAGPATMSVSAMVAASFAGGLSPAGATAMAFPTASAPAPLPAAPLPAKVASVAPAASVASARPADTSPARIDRQEREPGVRERADAAYRRGVEAMHEGRMTAAEQALRDALTQFPGHEVSRQTLLGMLVQQRRNVDAEALLVEGQRQNPAQLGFAMALARLQAERGDTAAALDSLQRSAAAGRDRPEFLGFQAGLLARDGRHADATVQYRSALRMAPQNAVWWMGLGISLEADRRPADAAEAFQRAREANGLSAELTAFVEQRLRSLQR